MSKVNKSKSKDSQKSESSKDNHSKNFGPTGSPLFEYLGPGKDHSQQWLKLKRDLKIVIIDKKLDSVLKQIIDDGVDPEIEALDFEELMKNEPSKYKVETAQVAQEESKFDLNDPEKLNPYYDLQMSMFKEDLKTASKTRMLRVLQLDRDKKTFYTIIWMQCGISMQNHIRSFKSFADKHLREDVLWLYKALESVGCGAVALQGDTAAASTLDTFVGMQMSAYETIHTY